MKRDRVNKILKKYFSVFSVFLGVFLLWLLFSKIIIYEFSEYKDSLQNLGMFGDSFNILTSLFTGLAFGGVLISIHLQKEELIKVSDEMLIQSFDNKFFQMLNVFNNIIKNLNYKMIILHGMDARSSK